MSATFSLPGSQYDQIVGLFLSSHLNRTFYNAHEAAKNMRGGARVEIVDSHTTAIGLGLIVQTAAKAASQGYDAKGIRRIILGVIPRIYSVFCVRGLTYLQRTGHLSPAQALVGEMLGVTPFFVMDRGRLTPVQKIRSSRHQVDCLHEFVSEFEQLNHIGILQGVPPFTHEKRVLRERILEDFPTTQVSEHTINPVLAAILGPQTMGLFVWEASKNDIVLTQFGEK
ncbi:MAG: DegV family protein [Anaerolineales bacterium]